MTKFLQLLNCNHNIIKIIDRNLNKRDNLLRKNKGEYVFVTVDIYLNKNTYDLKYIDLKSTYLEINFLLGRKSHIFEINLQNVIFDMNESFKFFN